jgi:MarR family transcriptional regulator, transcriptional regulator for hemolysin
VAPPNDLGPVAPLRARASTHSPPQVAAASRPELEALQPNIGAMVHDVARLIRRRFERRARQTGLSLTRHQARTLLYIARAEGLSQATAATRLDIEPIALVRLLDRLHEEGLVDRRPHPTDRRVRTLWLTPLGWRAVERVLAINAEVREEACAGLSQEARDALMAALGRIKDNLTLADEESAAAAE